MNVRDLEVVVVGNIGIDTNVYGAEGRAGVESAFTENLDCIGQAGGYGARGFARLDKRTAFIGYVGDDFAGRHVLETLRADGVDTTAVFVDPAGTSRSVNFMGADGTRRNYYDGKSHMALDPDPVACEGVLARARLAHFNIPHWARRLLGPARRHGLVVSCDLQDAQDVDDPYRRDFVEAADIVFVSAVNHEQDPGRLLRALLERRPHAIVVSGLGARGCALGTREGIRFFPALDDPRPVVDTNGAGDSLAVGFLASYVLEGRTLEESVLRGQVAARHACTLRGTSCGLISPAEWEQRVRRGAARW